MCLHVDSMDSINVKMPHLLGCGIFLCKGIKKEVIHADDFYGGEGGI